MHRRTLNQKVGSARRALTIAECLVALALLLAAMIGVTQLLVLGNRHRSQVQRQQLALTELANWTERASILPLDDLTSDKLLALPASNLFATQLPKATRTAQVEEIAGKIPGKKIHLAIAVPGQRDLQLISFRWAPPATPSPEGQP